MKNRLLKKLQPGYHKGCAVCERKRAILSLRIEFAFFGYDTRNITDDEIENGMQEMAELVRASRFSADDLTRVAIQLGRVGASANSIQI